MRLIGLGFLALFLGPQAWGCRCDFRPLEQVRRNPAAAQTAFEGTVTAASMRGSSTEPPAVIEVTRVWKGQVKEKIVSGNMGSCSLELERGKRFVFLVIGPLDHPLNFCSTVAIESAKAEEARRKLGGDAAAKPPQTGTITIRN